jgi:succinate dehydrogenase hydrophobic anchor subunit
MIPAHMMFMHLNLSAGHDAYEIISRMRIIFIKILDMLIMTCALYHGGYGLLSILKDYLYSSVVIRNMTLLVIIISMTFAWLGLKTILFV